MNPDILFENFDMLADAPNGVPNLREMVLQLAIQGKLVPQDPKDEPASVLLEKIKAEKERLIKKRKIKKTKPFPPITSDEIPYELPDRWEWVRMANVFDVRDGTHDTPKYVSKGFPLITSKNISSGKLELSNVKFISPKDHEKISARSFVEKYDILFAMIGSIGNPVIVDSDQSFSIKNVALFKYFSKQLSNPEYLLLFLKYASEKMRSVSAGGVQSFVSLTFLRNYLFPFPPLNEQKRIGTKVSKLMAICDELEARKKKRDKTRIALNDAALDRLLSARKQKDFTKHWNRISNNFELLYDNPENVNKLRQAILQLAVQGKLVSQDPNDLPASVLLEKIKTEKERLIKEKKIKRAKPLPPIEMDEIPYELPKGWEWTRFADVIRLKHGHQFRSHDFVGFGIPVIKIGQCKEDGSLVLSSCDYIDKSREKEFSENKIYEDDLLMALTGGTLGKVTRVNRDYGVVVQNYRVGKFIPVSDAFDKSYSEIILRSNLFQALVGDAVNQNAQPNIGKSKIELLLIPCPPQMEQKIIVAKVDQLIALCDELEAKLSQSQSDCDELLIAIVSNIEKVEPNKTALIEEHINTPEKKETSTSKPQRKTEKSEKKFDKVEVLKAFRKTIFRQKNIDKLTLLRLVGQCLGIKQLSQPIRHELESYINTAIRRKILYRNGDGYSARNPTIEHYDDDFLIKVLRSVSLKGWEYHREHLVKESANYLGFDKVSDAFKNRMKSIFQKAIRQKALYRKGAYFGKV